jgi:hypothetical protein
VFLEEPAELSCENGNEHSDSINVGIFLSNCKTAGFSRMALLQGVSFSNKISTLEKPQVEILQCP